jgi:hypothetical protein
MPDGSRDAPTTATARGRKNGFSDSMSYCCEGPAIETFLPDGRVQLIAR